MRLFNTLCTYHARIEMNILPAILEKKTNRNGKVNIKIRISHNRKVRDIGTKYYIDPNHFLKNGKISDELPGADFINFEIQKTILGYQEKLLKVNYKNMPIDRILEILRNEEFINSDFSAYFRKVMAKKARTNARTGLIFQTTLDKIEKFDPVKPLLFDHINTGWLRDFEGYMKQCGNEKGTMSLHFRNIRTVFNDAIDHNEISITLYPFRRYKIPTGNKEQTPLTLDQLKMMVSIQLEFPYLQMARNVFMLSFCLIGINSSDLMDVKEPDIAGGRLRYDRNKTRKKYNIKLEPEAMAYIEKMRGEKALINLQDRFKNTNCFTSATNALLKRIGREIGAPSLTMYTARHTWASLAKNVLKVDDNDISAALGHSIGGVTQTYIHRNQEYIDKINRKLLDKVFKTPKLSLPRKSSKNRYKNCNLHDHD